MRRTVPHRRVDELIILARPADGAPVVLGPTAGVIWDALDEWQRHEELTVRLATVYPGVAATERSSALLHVLESLEADDLVRRR